MVVRLIVGDRRHSAAASRGQVRSEQGTKDAAVVWYLEVEQLVDDNLSAELGGLTQQFAVEADPAGGRTACPFAHHRNNPQRPRLDLEPPRPSVDLRFEQVRGHSLLKGLPVTCHDSRRLSIASTRSTNPVTSSTFALISAL